MNYMSRLDPETREKVLQAKKAASKESKAARLQRARDALATATERSRRPRERNNEHLQFVRRGGCLPCAILGEHHGPARAAHVRSSYPEPGWSHTGMAQKPDDSRTIGACDHHHTDGPQAQHKMNERDFWDRLGVYPPEVCAALVAARAAGADPAETVEQIASTARRNRAQERQS